jgi:hypothetical protein
MSGPSLISNPNWPWHMYDLDLESQNILFSLNIAIIGCNFVINTWTKQPFEQDILKGLTESDLEL